MQTSRGTTLIHELLRSGTLLQNQRDASIWRKTGVCTASGHEGSSLPSRCTGVSRPLHKQHASLTALGHRCSGADTSSATEDRVLLFTTFSQHISKADGDTIAEVSVSPMALLVSQPLLQEPSTTGLSSTSSGPVTMSEIVRQVNSHDSVSSCFFSHIIPACALKPCRYRLRALPSCTVPQHCIEVMCEGSQFLK